jgi:phage/plasmid-like protein (TIGR03299 family)
MTNRRANMVYVGATPWHSLGTRFAGNENFDEWRVAAGFAWEATPQPLTYPGADGNPVSLDSHKVLLRSDVQSVLGVVGKDYKVVQPAKVIEFFRDIAFASDSRYTMETAGCLFDGRRIWALARTAQEMRIGGTDVVKPYILLGTSFDGSMATFASYTSVRVVCHNTLTMAVGLKGTNADIRIPHSQTFDEKGVKVALGVIESGEDAAIENFEEMATILSKRRVNTKDAFTYFATLYGPELEEGQKATTLKLEDFSKTQERHVSGLHELFLRGPGAQLKSAKSTAWGLLNAVTNYEDFGRWRTKKMERIVSSSQFGNGAQRKKTAAELAIKLAA